MPARFDPAAAMRVIVTRPAGEAAEWAQGLHALGFDALVLPLIEIAPVVNPAPVLRAWSDLAGMQAAMFVSANAVRHFFALRPAEAAWPWRTRAWATGNGTREALLAAGVAPGAIDAPPHDAAQFDSEALWAEVGTRVHPGDKVLLVRGAEADGEPAGREWMAERLASAGVQVKAVAAYVRRAPDASALETLVRRQGDVWLFSSSQAIAHLVSLLPGVDWSGARAVATHRRIADTARRAGFGVVCESRPGMAAVGAALESLR